MSYFNVNGRSEGGVVAVGHIAPDFSSIDSTISRISSTVREATSNGASIVAFGEAFIPGFPLWCSLVRPIDHHARYRDFYRRSVEVPGEITDRLSAIAKRYGCYLSIGVSERGSQTVGLLYNSNLVFAPSGDLVRHHRKLVPTWAEKLVWANGDGAGLVPFDVGFCAAGVLICGENTNPLARYALMAQGEQLHLGTWPPAWPFDMEANEDYVRWIEVRTASHAFEAKVVSIAVSYRLDESAIADLAAGDRTMEEALRNTSPGASLVVGPNGSRRGMVLQNEEGILYTDVDIADSITPKLAHDLTGGYQRPDVFELTVDFRRRSAITRDGDDQNRR